MLRGIIKFIPAIASFLIGVGLQVSGIEIPLLGYSLMILGGLLLIIPLWPIIRKPKMISNPDKPNAQRGNVLNIVDKYEDNVGECGLIFSNSGSTNLVNCHARLLDVDYETLQKNLTLKRFSRVEDLICNQNVAGFGNGKIPLFRWGKGTVSKRLEIVYQKGTESIGYGVANIPILMLVDLWADGTQTTYAVCKLEDRLGWGYKLSILKTGFKQDEVELTTFQKPIPDKGETGCQ